MRLNFTKFQRIFPLILLLSPLFLYSQSTDSVALLQSVNTFKRNKFSLQVLEGTQGFGLNLRYAFFKPVALRVGGSYATVGYKKIMEFKGFNSDLKARGTFNNVHALLELFPHKKLHLVGGVALLNDATALLTVAPQGTYKWGEIEMQGDDIGKMDVNVKWQKLAPYFGFSLGRGIPKDVFNINMDFGVYHLSSPEARFVGTNMLASNSENDAIVTNNMKDYRWMPVIQFNFNFRL